MSRKFGEVNCMAFDSGYCVHNRAPEKFLEEPGVFWKFQSRTQGCPKVALCSTNFQRQGL